MGCLAILGVGLMIAIIAPLVESPATADTSREFVRAVPSPVELEPMQASAAVDAAVVERAAAHKAEARPSGRYVTMEVTAYCPCHRCCGPNAQGITASGKRVSYNNGKFVAADRKFAFGTQMIIPGYANGAAIEVIDRGGAIKGNKLDVYFDSHQEALNWGRKTLQVRVLD